MSFEICCYPASWGKEKKKNNTKQQQQQQKQALFSGIITFIPFGWSFIKAWVDSSIHALINTQLNT